MKKLLLLIVVLSVSTGYATSAQLPGPESIQYNDFFNIITEYARLQDAYKELKQLRRHAQTASKILWIEKSQKNVEICREIVRRYLVALEKLPEYDEQKQAWKKAVQNCVKKNDNSQTEAHCYTAS